MLGSGRMAPSRGGYAWVCPALVSRVCSRDMCLRLELDSCGSPSIPSPGPCVHQEVFGEWGEVCWRPAVRAEAFTIGPLCAAHSSLNSPRSQLLLRRPPRGRGRQACSWDCRCSMDWRGLGFGEGLGGTYRYPQPPPLLTRFAFKKLMVFYPLKILSGPHFV